jgi:hypothetical protein
MEQFITIVSIYRIIKDLPKIFSDLMFSQTKFILIKKIDFFIDLG